MRWFDVTLDTPMREIGWTWVVLLIGTAVVARGAWWLWRNW